MFNTLGSLNLEAVEVITDSLFDLDIFVEIRCKQLCSKNYEFIDLSDSFATVDKSHICHHFNDYLDHIYFQS